MTEAVRPLATNSRLVHMFDTLFGNFAWNVCREYKGHRFSAQAKRPLFV